ncbi:MAG: hypothetical protein AAFX00_02955 [Pseudomonadota bacterium]
MTAQITITTDPARPHGGYARLSLPSQALSGQKVGVSVFDPYSNRHLGRDGFQAGPAQFGPYPVERSGDQAWVTIGPEIVNQVEEYAVVEVTVGSAKAQISWPEDVVPAFGAARIGDIFSGAIEDEPVEDPHLVGQLPKAKPEPEPEPEPSLAPAAQHVGRMQPPVPEEPAPEPNDPEPEEEPEKEPEKGPNWALVGGLGLLAAAVAGAAVYFLVLAPGEEVADEEGPGRVTVGASPEDQCSDDSIAAWGSLSFGEARRAMVGCAEFLSADRALVLLETAANAGDAEALLMFGKAYDGAQTDRDFEEQLGVTFGDRPAQAAEYYARAAEAGSTTATPLLEAVCTRLARSPGTTERSALQDWCL